MREQVGHAGFADGAGEQLNNVAVCIGSLAGLHMQVDSELIVGRELAALGLSRHLAADCAMVLSNMQAELWLVIPFIS